MGLGCCRHFLPLPKECIETDGIISRFFFLLCCVYVRHARNNRGRCEQMGGGL